MTDVNLESKRIIKKGIQDDDKMCSFTGFLHNKRMYYVENYKGTDKILKEFKKKTNKEKLEFFKKEVKEGNILTEDEMKTKMKENFSANFEKIFKVKPSKNDFIDLDDDLNDKCKNLPDLKPFLPDDPSEMGGHPRAFVNVVIEGKDGNCDIWGGKKWEKDSVTEYAFYQYIYKNKDSDGVDDDVKKLFKALIKNISEFQINSKCKPANPLMPKEVTDDLDYHFPISNAKNLVRKDNEKIHDLDFKLGYRTAFKHEKGQSWKDLTKIRDDSWSLSYDVGFRLEGCSAVKKLIKFVERIPKESGWKSNIAQTKIFNKKSNQYYLYLLNPGFIFDTIFYTAPDQDILNFKSKLERFEEEFIQQNFKNYISNKKSAIAFIGCSIYLVMGGNGIDFKLIDFAHPYVLSSINNDVYGKERKLSNDKSCCAVNTVTGEEFKQQTSENNKLRFRESGKSDLKKEIKTAKKARETQERRRKIGETIIEDDEKIRENTDNLLIDSIERGQQQQKLQQELKENVEKKNKEIADNDVKINNLNEAINKTNNQKEKLTEINNELKKLKYKNEIKNLSLKQTEEKIREKTQEKGAKNQEEKEDDESKKQAETNITTEETNIGQLNNEINTLKNEIKGLKAKKKNRTDNEEKVGEGNTLDEQIQKKENDLKTKQTNLKTEKTKLSESKKNKRQSERNKNKHEREETGIDNQLNTLNDYKEKLGEIIQKINEYEDITKNENFKIVQQQEDVKNFSSIKMIEEVKRVLDIINKLLNKGQKSIKHVNNMNETKAIEIKKMEEEEKKQEEKFDKLEKEEKSKIGKERKLREKHEQDYKRNIEELNQLMFKASLGDFGFKDNITYKEWSNTFQNFMGGLLSFVYSYYFWYNTRIHADNNSKRNSEKNKLKKKFSDYNKYFDKNPPNKPSTPDEKQEWDPPYLWTQDKKPEKIDTLISKSKSNLLNRPKQ